MSEYKKPWWFPKKTDAPWCDSIREEYAHELDGDESDEDIREIYADGGRYETLWDHVGDAYEQFAVLADHYLELWDEGWEIPVPDLERHRADNPKATQGMSDEQVNQHYMNYMKGVREAYIGEALYKWAKFIKSR